MLKHIAIIMDGNGRWAAAKGHSRTAGHRQGAEAARAAIRACVEHNISYLTLYAFSAENWERPQDEVIELMDLLRFYLNRELKSLHENGVKVQVIGNRSRLAKDIEKDIAKAETLTANNTRLHLTVALSYGSRQEIVEAVKRLLAENPEPGAITEKSIERYLYTHTLPDPDLLIRTGGEQRLSNFLLWQSAYTELYFTPVLWPDFTEKDLKEAIDAYEKRERRYGRVAA